MWLCGCIYFFLACADASIFVVCAYAYICGCGGAFKFFFSLVCTDASIFGVVLMHIFFFIVLMHLFLLLYWC